MDKSRKPSWRGSVSCVPLEIDGRGGAGGGASSPVVVVVVVVVGTGGGMSKFKF